MNNKIAVVLALADVKYSLNDLEKHYKTFCGLYTPADILTDALDGTAVARWKIKFREPKPAPF